MWLLVPLALVGALTVAASVVLGVLAVVVSLSGTPPFSPPWDDDDHAAWLTSLSDSAYSERPY